MSRESNDGFVCPKCGETIYREQCACQEPPEEPSAAALDLQGWLERCHTISLMQQRLRATNDSRAIQASNANSRALIEALRGHL
jgi:hypothetical protein